MIIHNKACFYSYDVPQAGRTWCPCKRMQWANKCLSKKNNEDEEEEHEDTEDFQHEPAICRHAVQILEQLSLGIFYIDK